MRRSRWAELVFLAEEIARNIAYIDLMKDNDFMEEYTAAYFLPGKKELFPTWWEASRKIKREVTARTPTPRGPP